jgi:hypothetical protein
MWVGSVLRQQADTQDLPWFPPHLRRSESLFLMPHSVVPEFTNCKYVLAHTVKILLVSDIYKLGDFMFKNSRFVLENLKAKPLCTHYPCYPWA